MRTREELIEKYNSELKDSSNIIQQCFVALEMQIKLLLDIRDLLQEQSKEK